MINVSCHDGEVQRAIIQPFRLELVAAIDAEDSESLAALILENPHIYILNESRGMVQVLNRARNGVQWQLTTDVPAVATAMNRIVAERIGREGVRGH